MSPSKRQGSRRRRQGKRKRGKRDPATRGKKQRGAVREPGGPWTQRSHHQRATHPGRYGRRSRDVLPNLGMEDLSSEAHRIAQEERSKPI